MGSYFALKIRGYDFISGKSYLEPIIGILFSELERECSTDSDGYEMYIYRSSSIKLLNRLAIWGFTPERARKEFEDHLKRQIDSLTDEDNFYGDELLKEITIEKWTETILRIINDEKYYCRWNARESNDEMYRLLLEDEDFYYGFPTSDIRYMIVTVLAALPENEEVILDYSDLVHGGYYEKEVSMVASSWEMLKRNRVLNEHIIILTEGKFDTFVLSETLLLLYPDLSNSFSFLDFDASKAPGGAGQLTNYIKALSGAQISDRIIAIFDNDSAAHSATRNIWHSASLCRNICIFFYPEYELLSKYPTIGPSGIVYMDVNRLAASVELYLGRDVLTSNGEYIPIKWTGYIKELEAYQGEIANKDSIQEKFKEKLYKAQQSSCHIEDQDWEGIKHIWRSIFHECEKNAV